MKKIMRKALGSKILIIGVVGLLFGAGGLLAARKFFADGAEPASIAADQAAACREQVIGASGENERADLFVNCGGFLD